MSIQPSQVASIDWSRKPKGATHYFMVGSSPWRDLSGLRWKWFDGGAWNESGVESKDLLERRGSDLIACPADMTPSELPDWSKGPSNATHFGPAGGPFHEAFFQLVDGSWLIAHWENDWFWREYRNMGNDRIAMLIERPKGIDWSAAPEWAIGHGLLSDDQAPAWIGKAQYLYVGSRATPYQFSSDHDHPLFFHRDDVKGYVARPAQDFASQVQEGIDDAEAGNLIALDDVKARWEGRSAWNGEGRPPVGIVCEARPNSSDSRGGPFSKCEVVRWHHKNDVAVLVINADTAEPFWTNSFRPIRTPEQIAADERLHKIRNAATDIASTLEACSKTVPYKDIAATVIEAMIDAGYASPVKA